MTAYRGLVLLIVGTVVVMPVLLVAAVGGVVVEVVALILMVVGTTTPIAAENPMVSPVPVPVAVMSAPKRRLSRGTTSAQDSCGTTHAPRPTLIRNACPGFWSSPPPAEAANGKITGVTAVLPATTGAAVTITVTGQDGPLWGPPPRLRRWDASPATPR